ncbi:hypothetical protein [Jiangella muralis]|uniref:hypothetical protein n=1 Tax=Jiangella muralis TaxID=702383 RepID=UPI00069E9C3C|nr:hypothetical protein [Jiangella muralis]
MADAASGQLTFDPEEEESLGGLFLGVGATTTMREDRTRDGIPMPPAPAPLLTTRIMLPGRPVKPSRFAGGGTVLGQTFDQILERARDNTLGLEIGFEQHRRFARGVQVTGSRLSGLLAVPEVFEPHRAKVDGELLVFAPTSRDIALVGSEEPELWVAWSYAVIEYAAALPPGLSPLLYRVVPADDAGSARLEAWVPAADAESRKLYERARLTQLENTYGPMMQDALADQYSYRDGPATVARPLAAYNADLDAVLSYAVWNVQDPLPCLVAPTDSIAIDVSGTGEAPQLWISPADLSRVPGVRLTETREFGPPIRVAEFTDRTASGELGGLVERLIEHGARTAAELGGLGEPASILDWVPSKNGWYGKRAKTATTFPTLQWPAA